LPRPRRFQSRFAELNALRRILIVDDSQSIRDALRAMLVKRQDWIICGEAANGLQAIQMAGKLKPDIILLDFQMPVMNGLNAAKEIKRLNPSLQIAMYTLHQNTQFERAATAAGVEKVISKADVFSSLVPSLEPLLRRESSN